MSILVAEDLTKEYGVKPNIVKALDHVNLSVEEKDFVAVVGTSGSGKSTLLHMLGALDSPTSGCVSVDGKDIFKMNEEERTVFRRKKIGFIFQNFNLIPIMNVYDNIVLPIMLDGKTPDESFVKKVIEVLGLSEKLNNLPSNLSGGQQQRVAIARALATKPAIILADEPTGNLDSKTGEEVMNLLKSTTKEFGQTAMIITHDEKVAAKADYRIRIEDGKITGEK
ncbi:MAG: ABC transporter ATP-binding protein [Lachnospiraceae bacterium]|jgi:putative ABC transport system ATP-binding protein|nr:ABC transporter ATP-binding protein [Lachnospiraceae bacterium]